MNDFFSVSADKLPKGFPQITQSPITNKVVEIGHSAMLTCAASGNPPPKITWLKNMLPINTSSNPRYSFRDDMPGTCACTPYSLFWPSALACLVSTHARLFSSFADNEVLNFPPEFGETGVM